MTDREHGNNRTVSFKSLLQADCEVTSYGRRPRIRPTMFAELSSIQEVLGSVTNTANTAKRKAARKAAEFAYFSSRYSLRACTHQCCRIDSIARIGRAGGGYVSAGRRRHRACGEAETQVSSCCGGTAAFARSVIWMIDCKLS